MRCPAASGKAVIESPPGRAGRNRELRPMLVNAAHMSSCLLDRRLDPEISAGIDRPAFLYFRQLIIDQQAVLSIHENEVTGITSGDDGLGHKHRLCQAETESLRAMERDEAIAHRD